MATWQPNRAHAAYQDDLLVTDDGQCIGRIEDYGQACHPSAVNAATGRWERGGAYSDPVAAMAWAERVAGLHPTKPGDTAVGSRQNHRDNRD